MTNQKPPENNQKPPAGGGDVMSKLSGGLSWWIGSLTGKPKAKKQAPQSQVPAAPATSPTPPTPPVQVPAQTPTPSSGQSQPPTAPVQAQQPQAAPSSGGGDSVMQDIANLKKLVGKFSNNIQKKAGPGVSKGVSSSEKVVSQIAQKAGKSNFLKNLLKVFFVILILMILALLAMRLFKNKPGGTVQPTATPAPTRSQEESPTPTPFVFNPKNPSLYAEDEEILSLEKEIDVLVREISGTNIKETQLNPPILDFNVTF